MGRVPPLSATSMRMGGYSVACAALVVACGRAGFDGVEADITKGLVGHWKLDERGNTFVAADTSPYHQDGALIGFGVDPSASWVDGIDNGALTLDGIDDYVHLGAPPRLAALNEDFTLAAWFNLEADQFHSGIIGKGDTVHIMLRADDGGGTMIGHGCTGRIVSADDVGAEANVRISTGGLWHHCAMTVGTRSEGVSVYLDGKLGEHVDSSAVGPLVGLEPWSIGFNARNTGYFIGEIDDVRIYDRVLSPAEIRALANR